MATAVSRGAPEAPTGVTVPSLGAATLALCLENCHDFLWWTGGKCIKMCRDSEDQFLTFGNLLADFGIQSPNISLGLIQVSRALLAGGTLYLGYRSIKYVRSSLGKLPDWVSFVYVVAMHFRQRKHLRSQAESSRENEDLEPALYSKPSSMPGDKTQNPPETSRKAQTNRLKPAERSTKPRALPTVSKFAAKRPRPKGKLPYPGPYPLFPEPPCEGISGEIAVFRMLWAFWHILVTHARESVEDANGHLLLDFKAGELYAFAVEHEYGNALGSPDRTEQILLDLIRSKRFPDNFTLAISPAADSQFHTGLNERVLRCTLDSMLDINGLWDPFDDD